MINKPKCNVQYFEEDGQIFWVCPNNFGYRAPRKKELEKCWKYNCPGRKPASPSILCANVLCKKLLPEDSNSKYCSRLCLKRQNQRNYTKRKKNETS